MSKDTLVWVKNQDTSWELAHYAYLGDNGEHYCYSNGCTEQQADGAVDKWEEVKEAR